MVLGTVMKDLRVILVLGILGWLIFTLRAILTPFLLAFLLAYISNPLVLELEKRKIHRTYAVIIVFSVIFINLFLFFMIFIPIMGAQFDELFNKLPAYVNWIRDNVFYPISQKLNLNIKFTMNNIMMLLHENIASSKALFGNLMKQILGSANFILIFIGYLFLVPFITFYLLRDWKQMNEKFMQLIPRRYESTANHLLSRCDYVLSGFLRGQFLVMMALVLMYSFGLTWIGLDTAITVGTIAGLISFVPYLGFIFGMTVAILLAILQFQDFWHPMGVFIVFSVSHIIEGMYLTPKLIGDRTGLHAVTVLFALLAGGSLFGLLGVLLAIPVMAILNVFLSHFKNVYLNSKMYQ